MEERAPELVDMDAAAARYQSVLSGMRLCQLYGFWMLLDLIMRPLGALNQIIAYLGLTVWGAVAGFDASPWPDLTATLSISRGPADLLALLLVWVIFAYHSRFRAHWAIIGAGILLTCYNLMVFHDNIYAPETGFLADLMVVNLGDRLLYLETEVATARAVQFGLIALLHLQFLYIAFRGQRDAMRMTPEEKTRFADYAPGERFFGGTTRRLLQIPPAIRYARRKAATVALLLVAGLANLINYWLVVVSVALLSASWLVFHIFASLLGGEGFGAERYPVAIVITLLLFAFALSIGLWLRFLVRRAARLAQRFMRRSLEDVQHVDERAPILFLRSFLNDQVALPPKRFDLEQWLFDGGSRRANLDQTLLTEGTVFGPMVALGDPSDPAPPYGAARGYFEHADWQAAVARLCRESAGIVMVLDRTEGVEWEVRHLSEGRYAAKTLLLLSPEDAETDEGRAMLRKAASRIFGLEITSNDGRNVIGVEQAADNSLRLIRSERLNVYAYTLIARRFLSRVAG